MLKFKRKVAIIDDTKADCALFQRYLAQDPDHEYEIIMAASGAAGLETIKKEAPDCVLLDYRLPDMTGIEVLAHLRGELKLYGIPIVMLTGSEDEFLVVRALKNGAQDYLSKTALSAANLLRAVHNAIEKVQVFKKMEDAIQVRDEIMSIASHELKTPLTSLTLQLGQGSRLLRSNMALDPQHQNLVKIFTRASVQVDRLTRLVNQLLDVSRISGGMSELHAEPLDLVELVRDAIDRLREMLFEAQCPIEFHAPGSVIGHFDRFKLDQVIVNLLSNAIKYASAQPVCVEVFAADAWGIVRVRDQGMGISLEHQSRIFDRFDRGMAPKGTQGLGLGLYIAKKNVNLHAGSLTVQSELGKGSTFTIRVPLRTEAEGDTAHG